MDHMLGYVDMKKLREDEEKAQRKWIKSAVAYIRKKREDDSI